MAASPPKPPSTVEGEALLQSLGYNQQLKRKINVLGNLALVLSDITPTASHLIVGTVVIVGAGTGSIAAYLIGCFGHQCRALHGGAWLDVPGGRLALQHPHPGAWYADRLPGHMLATWARPSSCRP